jgi:O-antigen/teichoic acid export membrane protein
MAKLNYTKKAIRGTSIIFAMGIMSSLMAYLIRILLARNLTVAEYGFVYSVFALFGLFSVFQNMGMDQALVKYIAEFKSKKLDEKIKSSIVTAACIQFFSAVIIGLLFILFSNFIASNYFHDASLAVYIRVYAIAVILSPSFLIFKAIFQGFQKMFYFSLIEFLQMSFIFVATLILLELGFGLMSPFVAYASVYTLNILFYYLAVGRVFRQFWKVNFCFDRKLTKKLVFFGAAVMLVGMAGIIFNYLDTFILTLFRSLEEVGLYNTSFPTARVLWTLSGTLGLVLLPLSSELWAKKDLVRLKEGVRMLYKYSLMLIIPASLVFFIFPSFVLLVLFGGQYIPGANALRILAVGTIFFTISQVNNSMLTGIGKPQIVSKMMLIAAAVNLLGNIVLIPYYGIEGAAFSTIFSFFVLMVLSYRKIHKIITVTLSFRKVFLILLDSLLFLGSVYFMKTVLEMGMWAEAIVSLIFGGVIYLAGLFFFDILSTKEIKIILGRLK